MLRWLAWLLFSLSGRIPRKWYWLAQAILLIPGIIGYVLTYGATLPETVAPPTIASNVLSALLLIPAFAVARKRLNDRGHGTWASVLWLALAAVGLFSTSSGFLLDPLHVTAAERALLAGLMVVSLWFFIDLGLLPGESGPNRYGPDPLGREASTSEQSFHGRTFGSNVRDALTGFAALVAVLILAGFTPSVGTLIEWAIVPTDLRENIKIWKEQQANEPALKAQEEGSAASKAGDFETAIRHFSRAIDLYGRESPAAAWSYHLRAFAFRDLGRLQEALSDHDKALSLNPYFPGGFRWRGDLLSNLGRYDDALKDFSTALKMLPDSSSTLNARGLTLERMGRKEDALADYDKAITATHRDDKLIERLESIEDAGPSVDKEQLERSRRDAITYRDENIIYARSRRGDILRGMKRFEEALAEYEQVLAIRPEDAHTYLDRGWLYEQQGRLDLARADYQKAATLMTPDDC
jgi:tetratricopeptide (TPR) repeat protein